MTSRPLLLRFLAAVGLGSGAAVVAAGSAVNVSCCPPPESQGPYTYTLNAECSVRLESTLHSIEERCAKIPAAMCPAAADASTDLGGEEVLCGPFTDKTVATTASSTSAATTSSTSTSTGSASGGGGGMGGAGGGPAMPTIECCYGVLFTGYRGQGCGRPLLVDGLPRYAPVTSNGDWTRALSPLAEISPAQRRRLAHDWSRDATLEHASVASFARFTRDLLALGAPSELVRASLQAGLDEIDHARRCYALASRYAGCPVGPGALDASDAAPTDDAVGIATRALVEGCIGETIAAVVAAETLAVTTDPEARDALASIACDEAAHAELAFRFIAWAARDASVRAALAERAAEALRSAWPPSADARSDDPTLERCGQPGEALRARATREALTHVIAPALRAIVGQGGGVADALGGGALEAVESTV